MTQLQTGDKAPIFTLKNQDEKTVSLKDFKGQKLLIFFYPRASTPGCTTQACSVNEALPQFSEGNIATLGVSPDEPSKQKKFADKQGLTYSLLCDTEKTMAQAYGVWGEKSMYGKKYMGIIRSAFLIDEQGKIIETFYKISPKDTVPKILKAAQ